MTPSNDFNSTKDSHCRAAHVPGRFCGVCQAGALADAVFRRAAVEAERQEVLARIAARDAAAKDAQRDAIVAAVAKWNDENPGESMVLIEGRVVTQ